MQSTHTNPPWLRICCWHALLQDMLYQESKWMKQLFGRQTVRNWESKQYPKEEAVASCWMKPEQVLRSCSDRYARKR